MKLGFGSKSGYGRYVKLPRGAARRAGIAEALRTTTSRLEAQRAAARVLELDPHLGDVARLVALLLRRGDKPASAALLLETASRLYGPRTPSGRKAAADAERIWRKILPSEGGRNHRRLSES